MGWRMACSMHQSLGFKNSSKLLVRLKANSEMQNSEKIKTSKFNFLPPSPKRGLAHNKAHSILW